MSRPTSASSRSVRCVVRASPFTAPYVLIEGCNLVRCDSGIHNNGKVDCSGHIVVVGTGSAYDLFLTPELAYATDRALADVADGRRHFSRSEPRGSRRRQAAARSGRSAPGWTAIAPGRFMVIQ